MIETAISIHNNAAASAPAGIGRAGLAAVTLGQQIVVLGGHNGTEPLRTIEVFQPENPESRDTGFNEITPMLARRSYLAAAELGGRIIAIGGSADGRVLNTMEAMDVENDELSMWFCMPSMAIRRTLLGAASNDGKLYACGGFDGIRDLATAEMYELESNTWHRIMDMKMGRSYLACVAVGNFILAIGGQERRSEGGPRAFQTVEVFDLWSERWNPGVDMLYPRLGHAATTLVDENGEEFVYVTGGSNGSGVQKCVERFSVSQQVWEEVASMHTPRLGHAASVVNGKLYAIGGYDGQETLGTYECYDPKADQWDTPVRMHVPEEEKAKKRPEFQKGEDTGHVQSGGGGGI